MNDAEVTLQERTGRMYRRLLLLQCLFAPSRDADDPGSLSTGDRVRDAALCTAIREILDELTMQSQVLASVPPPLNEWRPGDNADDTRWRGLTELERRDLLSMMSGYERLLSWAEEFAPRIWGGNGNPPSRLPGASMMAPGGEPDDVSETQEFLRIERARMTRFRQDMGFLDRRRVSAGS